MMTARRTEGHYAAFWGPSAASVSARVRLKGRELPERKWPADSRLLEPSGNAACEKSNVHLDCRGQDLMGENSKREILPCAHAGAHGIGNKMESSHNFQP